MDLTGETAKRLQEEVRSTRERFVQAQRGYEHALAVALDTQFASDGATSLRIAGRDYAAALKDYNEAVQKLADFVLER